MITVKNLIFEYPGHRALDNVSFEIPEKTITALVGPNGSGKTTLMRCLTALNKPYSGDIFINGIDIVQNPRSCNSMIGFLTDFFGLYDNLTVRQSLGYYAMAYNVNQYHIASRIGDVAQKLNLTEKLDSKAGSLSRGQRQRLAIGQAIIHNPQILILDEPASGLDPEARYQLSQLFIELNKQGITLLVSSHILAELNEYANNLLIIREGKIVESSFYNKNASTIDKKIIVRYLNTNRPLEEILSGVEVPISVTNIDKNLIEIHLKGGELEQNQLLEFLIQKKMNVLEFYEKKESIQDEYLHAIGGKNV